MPTEPRQIQMHSDRFAGTRTPTMENDRANLGMGAAFSIVGILIAVLIFGSVSSSIATGLNSTKAAFADVTGVTGIVNVVPILLVVGVLFAVGYTGYKKLN